MQSARYSDGSIAFMESQVVLSERQSSRRQQKPRDQRARINFMLPRHELSSRTEHKQTKIVNIWHNFIALILDLQPKCNEILANLTSAPVKRGEFSLDKECGQKSNYSSPRIERHEFYVKSGSWATRNLQKNQPLLFLMLLLIWLLNASTYTCLVSAQRDNNHDLSRYDNPFQPPSPFYPNFWHSLYKRYIMPDQSSSSIMNPDSSQPRWSPTTDYNQDTLDTHIKNILVPRVSGTPGNIKVRQYIVNTLKSNDYHVELDEFTDSTPIGNVRFANIIASSNPNACRQLVIACHYDSKMMEGFLGATDSAVPCAMMLKMSETFKDSFRAKSCDSNENCKTNNNDLGLKFIFFDGEEAYVTWTKTDSLYGSRHLASKWEKQAAPSHCASQRYKNELGRLELMVLLDLIGTSDTSFVMYNRRIKGHYENLRRYERAALAKAGFGYQATQRQVAFKNQYVPLNFVEDDHVPFMKRGVQILSLLASPFPSVWHTINDNYEAIDFAKTNRILGVLEEFVANYSKVGP